MADRVVPQHDTWPPLKGVASDSDGPLPLASADYLTFIMKSDAVLVSGTADVIDPPDSDGFNWQYVWGSADTSVAGQYEVELQITWDAGTTPPEIQTVPEEEPLTLEIREDLGP